MESQSHTPADRIRELSAINEDVALMLASAANAVNALTNRPLSQLGTGDDDISMTDDANAGDDITKRKEAFKSQTKAYYDNIQAIIARLRRQAYALEEAGITTAQPVTSSNIQNKPPPAVANVQQQKGLLQQTAKVDVERITNGGLGRFDIGWLNSRGNKVGDEKEAELLQEVKELLEQELGHDDV